MNPIRYAIRPCPECNGHLRVRCPECGAEQDCDVCEGTGYDPECIDVERWKAACEAFQRQHRATCAWIVGGQIVGRMTLDGRQTLDARLFMFGVTTRRQPRQNQLELLT